MSHDNRQREGYQQMLREHEELRALLGKIHQLTSECTAPVAEVRETVTAFRRHVEQHFEAEESDGYFADAVLQAPRVSERVAALEAQHTRLREQLGGIAEVVAAFQASETDWKTLGEQLHQFSVDLMHHENEENELLQEVFTDDIGSKD